MKNVKFDARGFIDIEGEVYGDPVQAKLAMLGQPAETVAIQLEGDILQLVADIVEYKEEDGSVGYDVVSVDHTNSHLPVPSFGNVKAFFDL